MEELATLKDLKLILQDIKVREIETINLFLQCGRLNESNIVDSIFLYKVIDGVLYFKLHTAKEVGTYNTAHLLNMVDDLGLPEDTSIGIEFSDGDLGIIYTDFVKKIHIPEHSDKTIYFWIYDK